MWIWNYSWSCGGKRSRERDDDSPSQVVPGEVAANPQSEVEHEQQAVAQLADPPSVEAEHVGSSTAALSVAALREEAEMTRLEAYLSAARAARAASDLEAAEAAEAATQLTCVDCYDTYKPEDRAQCLEGHFLCGSPGDNCLCGGVHRPALLRL